MYEETTTIVPKKEQLETQPTNFPRGQKPRPSSPNALPISVNFAAGLLEGNQLKKPRSSLDFLLSFAGHGIAVVLLVLFPLLLTHSMVLPELENTILLAPPPPPPAAPPAAKVHLKVHPVVETKLYAPRVIPKTIAELKEEPAKSEPASVGVPGGVIGGVPGGKMGGVLGGILSQRDVLPPPPPPAKGLVQQGPLRVGGRVQAPRLIHQVAPIYPSLAKETRTGGDVVIDCVIDEQGNVTQMKLVSGNTLLVLAAFDAVKQWKYEPTLLNGTPVAVRTLVVVHFLIVR